MKYIRLNWDHKEDDTPVTIYSELDARQWEKRKIEIFSDGRVTFADSSRERGGSFLGKEPWPDLDRLSKEPEFELMEIRKEEFEAVWTNATHSEGL